MIYYGDLLKWDDLTQSNISCDCETTEKDFMGKIHCIGFSNRSGGVVFFMKDPNDMEKAQSLILSTILNNKFPYEIYFHNLFFDLNYIIKKLFPYILFKTTNVFAPFIHDSLLLARYLMTTGYQDHVDPLKRTAFGLKFLSEFHDVDDDQENYDDVVGDLKIEYVPDAMVADYCFDDCKNTYRLYEELSQISIREGTYDYFIHYHQPHAYQNVLHMGLNGIPVDVEGLTDSTNLLETLVEEIKDEIYNETRKIFDFNSPRDLSGIIFKNEALRDHSGKPLKKPFVTENDSVRLDTTTLKILEGQCNNPGLMAKIIFVLESEQALGVMQRLAEAVTWTKDGPRVYPKQSASASSARLRCTNPPVHGFGKRIFHHTTPVFLNSLNEIFHAKN